MIKLGLIGYPLGHSLSPKIHTTALKVCRLEGDYSLFPIESDDRQGLKDLLSRVRTGEITGLNVTIPHKQHVIEFIDELTPTAKAIGAVNTIYLRENKIVGDNTDAPGFLADLKHVFDFSAFSPQPSALILGAGGSARAVVYALSNDGWNVTIASRRMEQAEGLTNSFPKQDIKTISFDDLQPSTFDLLVNTTPIGMTPNVEQSPWPQEIPFPNTAVIYDLVYNPRETQLVREARFQGLNATTGMGMLIEQAALAFECWTGKTPSREILFESINH